MVEISSSERNCLSSLREDKRDVLLWSFIEGQSGEAWVDCKENPTAAVVVVADCCYLLGSTVNMKLELTINKDNLLDKCRGKLILVDDSSWISLLENICPYNLRRSKRYSIKHESDVFQGYILKEYISAIGHEFHIHRIDKSLYFKILEDKFMADCCYNYSSLEEFLEHGIGYVVIHNGKIVSAASSYSYCEGSIEITIGTLEDYRRKGLALAVASKLILECMERKVYPRWDAANIESVALAEKLGYHFNKEYEVYSIS